MNYAQNKLGNITVEKLIEELQKYPKDAQVFVMMSINGCAHCEYIGNVQQDAKDIMIEYDESLGGNGQVTITHINEVDADMTLNDDAIERIAYAYYDFD